MQASREEISQKLLSAYLRNRKFNSALKLINQGVKLSADALPAQIKFIDWVSQATPSLREELITIVAPEHWDHLGEKEVKVLANDFCSLLFIKSDDRLDWDLSINIFNEESLGYGKIKTSKITQNNDTYRSLISNLMTNNNRAESYELNLYIIEKALKIFTKPGDHS